MKILVFLVALFSLSSQALAQQSAFSGERGARTFEALAKGLVTFATDDALTAANLRLKKRDSNDARLDVFKYIGEFEVAELSDSTSLLLEVSPAFLNYRKVISGDPLASRVNVDTWAFGSGLGVDYRPEYSNFYLTPRTKLEYSRLKYRLQPTAGLSRESTPDLPGVRAWSVVPSLEVGYDFQLPPEETQLTLSSRASYVYIDATARSSEFRNFTSESSVFRNAVTLDFPVSIGSDNFPITLRPSFARVDLRGSVKNGFDLRYFYESTLEVVNNSLLSSYFREVGLEASYLYSRDIQGWRLGVVLAFG